MTDTALTVVHVSPRVQGHGGIETMLGYNRELPLTQRFVALFDRQPEPAPDYHNLDYRWPLTLAAMRRRFRAALAPYPGSIVMYHNGWALPLLHDLDGAARRIAFLHGDPAYHRDDLKTWRGLLDGAMGCCPGFESSWRELLPDLGEERCCVYRMPVHLHAPGEPENRLPGVRPLVLGYMGRIERAQKNLHRLPDLMRALEARGVDFRFELLGDGRLTPWLQARAGPRLRVHGWKSAAGGEIGRIIAGWDAAVYFSSNEGGPISLLETMAVGAIPFYPRRGGSWADCYAPQVDPACHYPPDDVGALAAAIDSFFRRPAADIAQARARSRALVADHGKHHYQSTGRGLINRVAGLPRISQTRPHRFGWSDLLPLGAATRWAPWAFRRS